jgi:hypothetical protein
MPWRLFKAEISSIKHVFLRASPPFGPFAVQSGLEGALGL